MSEVVQCPFVGRVAGVESRYGRLLETCRILRSWAVVVKSKEAMIPLRSLRIRLLIPSDQYGIFRGGSEGLKTGDIDHASSAQQLKELLSSTG